MEQLLAYVPYLLCPVAMGLMMWMMSRGARSSDTGAARQTASPVTVGDVSQPDERVGRLRAELAELHAHQDAVAAKLRQLSSGEPAEQPAAQVPTPTRR